MEMETVYAHHSSNFLSHTENRCEKTKARLLNFLGHRQISFRIGGKVLEWGDFGKLHEAVFSPEQ